MKYHLTDYEKRQTLEALRRPWPQGKTVDRAREFLNSVGEGKYERLLVKRAIDAGMVKS